MRKLMILFIMIMPVVAYAQVDGDMGSLFEMAAENNIFVGVRAAGMGGAQVAAGDDGSAVWYNPALLPRIRRMEISGALSHQRFYNETAFDGTKSDQYQLNKTRLSSLWGVFPVPTEQGGLSFAIAANRVKSFDRIFRFESSTGWLASPDGDGIGGGEEDLGGLWAYSLGGGIEVSRYVSVGASLELYDGKDKYTYFVDEIFDSDLYTFQANLKDDYSGYSAKVGLAYSSNPNFHFGATIKFPTYLTVKQEYFEDGWLYGELSEYKYTLPFSFGAGTLIALDNLLLALDLNYTDFTQMEYRSGVDSKDALLVRDAYTDVLSVSAGAEYFFPRHGLSLRAGYSRDPIPFTFYPVDDNLDIFTAGFGYLLDRSIKFDMAINFLNWSRRDLGFLDIGTEEKYRAQRIFLGITYRI